MSPSFVVGDGGDRGDAGYHLALWLVMVEIEGTLALGTI